MLLKRNVFNAHYFRQAVKPLSNMLAGLGLISIATVCAQAADSRGFNNTEGELHVYGELTESACRLDMASTFQDIALGTISTGSLQMPGDKGTSIPAVLYLRDCLPEHSQAVDVRTGQVLWSSDQPVVTVTFSAASDPDNPSLVQVAGASGFGLKVTDQNGRDVRLGGPGAPLFLTTGQNQLTYYITPVRTRAPLNAGAFRAQINFWLSYD